ncbi:hypothetical protein [Botrimarina sp.]|uniref:hypothetical protein n=1 Tax=Botrimarina sp. TaxID=2795802 RepID=UPI0032ECD754
MTDLRQHFIEIGTALDSSDAPDAALLVEPAVAYAEACHEANERLGEIASVLERGLRSEAIGLAERPPSLLDEVQQLDFPRRDEWVALLASLELQTPPPLALEHAAALNRAYGELQTLEPLLKKQRTLALGRAPLAARLQIARRLSEHDPENPVWSETVEEYEGERAKELDAELGSAVKEADHERIGALCRAILSSEWLFPPPEPIRRRAATLVGESRSVQARRALEALLPQIESAHSELDEAAIEPLARKWRNLAETASLPADDPLAERAAPALAWRDEVAQQAAELAAFNRAVLGLRQRLESSSEAGGIRSAYEAARRFGRPLPEELEARVENRLASLDRQRAIRLRLLAIAAGLLLAATVGAVGFYSWRAARQRAVNEHAAQLAEMLDAERLDEAAAYAQKVPAGLASQPRIAAVVTDVNAAIAARDRTAEEFDRLIAEAEARDPTQPDHGLLARLEELARTDSERSRVAEVRAGVTAAEREIRRDRERRLGAALQDWMDRLSVLEARLAEGERLTEQQRLTLVDDAVTALRAYPGVASSYEKRADTLVRKARGLVRLDERLGARSRDAEAVFAAIGSPKVYADAALRYLQEHADTPGRPAALRVAQDATWRDLELWEAVWGPYRSDAGELTPTQAELLLAAGRELLSPDASPQGPLAEAFRKQEPHLEKVAGRQAALNKLRGWLEEPLFSRMWAVKRSNDGVVYSNTPPKPDGQSVSYTELVSALGDTQTRGTVNPKWTGLAPHAEVAQRILRDLDPRAPLADWDRYFATEAVRLAGALSDPAASSQDPQRPAIHPQVGLDLLRRLLVTGAAGSLPYENAVRPTLDRINNSPVDFLAPWYLSDTQRASDALREARRVAAGLGRLDQPFRSATYREARSAVSTPPPAYRWVGAVDATVPAEPRIRLIPEPPGDCPLVLWDPAAQSMAPAGRVKAGRLEPGQLVGAPLFTPVFAELSRPTQPSN